MKQTATEFWKETLGEYPQTDHDKLSVSMMAEYASNVKIRLIERLKHELGLRYVQYPEGELQEDYHKRVLKGEGFEDALQIVNYF